MILNEESVAAFKELVSNPKKNGFIFPSLSEVFEVSEEPTPKDVLYNQYIELIKMQLPKVFFYIIMDGIYPVKKCANKDLGYLAKIKDNIL